MQCFENFGGGQMPQMPPPLGCAPGKRWRIEQIDELHQGCRLQPFAIPRPHYFYLYEVRPPMSSSYIYEIRLIK